MFVYSTRTFIMICEPPTARARLAAAAAADDDDSFGDRRDCTKQFTVTRRASKSQYLPLIVCWFDKLVRVTGTVLYDVYSEP